jgi:hypothetical protein
MDHFAGLDVSVKETSICIVDDVMDFRFRGKSGRAADITGWPSLTQPV